MSRPWARAAWAGGGYFAECSNRPPHAAPRLPFVVFGSVCARRRAPVPGGGVLRGRRFSLFCAAAGFPGPWLAVGPAVTGHRVFRVGPAARLEMGNFVSAPQWLTSVCLAAGLPKANGLLPLSTNSVLANLLLDCVVFTVLGSVKRSGR